MGIFALYDEKLFFLFLEMAISENFAKGEDTLFMYRKRRENYFKTKVTRFLNLWADSTSRKAGFPC